MTQQAAASLVRGVRRWDLVALVLNSIIGAGIFGLPSRLFALAGTYSLPAYLLCAIPVGLVILCFAEVGSRFKETGGPYLYARAAFGSVVGFQVGWLMWLARITAFAALCNLFVEYAGFFVPAAGSGTGRTLVVSAVVAMLTTANLIGIRTSVGVTNAFTFGKLAVLLVFGIAGLFFIDVERFAFAELPTYESFSMAMLLLTFAYTGFETATVPAGEVRNPGRDMPFALIAGTAIVVLVYVLIQVVCIGTLDRLGGAERPLAAASVTFMGTAGASLISAGALISVTGTMNGIVLGSSRLLFAMAEQSQLPRVLATMSLRFRTPHVAILATAAAMFALTLSSTFVSALTISTLARLITYAATCAALPVLRRKDAEVRSGFMVPAGPVVAVLGLVSCLWLLTNSTVREAQMVAIAAAIGLVLYVPTVMRRAKPAVAA